MRELVHRLGGEQRETRPCSWVSTGQVHWKMEAGAMRAWRRGGAVRKKEGAGRTRQCFGGRASYLKIQKRMLAVLKNSHLEVGGACRVDARLLRSS